MDLIKKRNKITNTRCSGNETLSVVNFGPVTLSWGAKITIRSDNNLEKTRKLNAISLMHIL